MPRVLEQELVCPTCGRTEKPPECHGKSMEFDGSVFFCSSCHKEIRIPTCCSAPMKLRRKVRDIRKELFGLL
ncbi:MAG: hypothetical protein JSV89_13035 [Spirochaetaceae bacterium]|nr:MAG: hypothetical protein JSV89_13035 [Spirochaetaceae bacterium]